MKLQPIFNWQKYEGEEETQREQFQFQLQSEHTLIANAINSTINDLSYFNVERGTGFTWVNGLQVWTLTVPIVWATGGLTSTNALNITLTSKQTLTVINLNCILGSSGTFIPVPYADTTAFTNQISIKVTGMNLILTAGSNRSAWSGYATVYYTK